MVTDVTLICEEEKHRKKHEKKTVPKWYLHLRYQIKEIKLI